MTSYHDMPASIRRFLLFFGLSVATSFLAIPETLSTPAAHSPAALIFTTLLIGVVDGVLLLFVWLASWGRRNWARWTLLVTFALGITSFAVAPLEYYRSHEFLTAVTALSTIFEAAALYFLFSTDASAWFVDNSV